MISAGFVFLSKDLLAQNGGDFFSGPASLIIAILILFFLTLVLMGERLIRTEASQVLGADSKSNFSLLPSMSDIFGKGSRGNNNNGEPIIKIKKGFNVKLEGEPSGEIINIHGTRYAMKPTSFQGISPIPKLTVDIGDNVKAGDELFFDKKRPEIRYVSPVSGEVIEVNRGAKRRIVEIVLLADKTIDYKQFDLPKQLDAPSIIDTMLQSGIWSLLRQRPFNVVPDHNVRPKNIFISTFDTAPYAVDTRAIVEGKRDHLVKGLEVLSELTDGEIYLGMNADAKEIPNELSAELPAKRVWFSGPHPSGNVGIQIHHIDPVRSGDIVWTLGLQELITIGRFFNEGIYDATRVISVAGNMVLKPAHVRTTMGCNLDDILKEFELENEDNTRIINGDVLSGVKTTRDGFLGVFDDQVSLIMEGDYYEPFGWLLPQKMRPSVSRSFPNWLFPNVKFAADSNTHGERRAFVVSGQYEKVLPMDIYPQHLMKAILTNDFEKMEGLGIRELVEEDLALCEFVCTSKMPLQKILREGLDEVQAQS